MVPYIGKSVETSKALLSCEGNRAQVELVVCSDEQTELCPSLQQLTTTIG